MNHHSKASEDARDQAKWEWYTSPPYEDEDAPLGLDDSEEVIRIIQVGWTVVTLQIAHVFSFTRTVQLEYCCYEFHALKTIIS